MYFSSIIKMNELPSLFAVIQGIVGQHMKGAQSETRNTMYRVKILRGLFNFCNHRLRTVREEIAFTSRPKIHSHYQIFRYSRSIFCLPHRPNFSDNFDLHLHWVSVVCVCNHIPFHKECFTLQSLKKYFQIRYKGYVPEEILNWHSLIS